MAKTTYLVFKQLAGAKHAQISGACCKACYAEAKMITDINTMESEGAYRQWVLAASAEGIPTGVACCLCGGDPKFE